MNKVSVIIHGPYMDNAINDIFKSISRVKNILLDLEVIVVIYHAEKEKMKSLCDSFDISFPVRYIICKDLLNPGYFNFNRQLHTVQEALKIIETDRFVIKLRNDQWIDWNKLIKILEYKNWFQDEQYKIVTTNCFTRKDRLYHPSDMFLCGWKKTMEDYFSRPFMKYTHVNCQLWMLNKIHTTSEKFSSFIISPESELFRSFLELKKWDIKNTFEDSYDAIKYYCYVINTWDIELRWNKKRNAVLPARTIILPYSFCLEPFAGAPKEDAACYARHDFSGGKTLKDRMYLNLSKILFKWEYTSKIEIREKIEKVLYSRWMPKGFRSFLKRSHILNIIKDYFFIRR